MALRLDTDPAVNTETAATEVLVVGAGPTGLSLAITLRRHGIAVRVVDRAAQPSGVSKALALWSASLEAFAGMGIIDAFLGAGKRMRSLHVGDGDHPLAEIAVGDGIDSPYPFPLLLPQSHTERLLGERAAALGVTIERGVALTGLAQDEGGVTATLQRGERTETVRARYLVGCDGARSTVRHALGIEFAGYTEPETFLLGDVQIEGGALDPHSIYVWWHGGGTVALFPYGDTVWRMFARRPEGGGDEPPTLAELQGHVERHGPRGLVLREPTWLSSFRINERLAARYRDGRCFLAGDAAHVHSPAGGQGMNTGIQDATNLGWKLAAVLRGRGDAELLLDSYEAERRPVARGVIANASQMLHAAFTGGRIGTLVKDVLVSLLGNLAAVQKRLQLQMSETEVVYREGPLVALGGPPLWPGRAEVGARARDATCRDAGSGEARTLWPLLGAPRHSLLVFADAGQPLGDDLEGIAAQAGDALQILSLGPDEDPGGEARARYRLHGPGWVLIRPDLVVAARGAGDDLTALVRYLERVVRARALP